MIFSGFLLFTQLTLFGQEHKKDKTGSIITNSSPKPDTFFCRVVETPARFKENADEWNKYLRKNIDYNIFRLNGAPAGTYEVTVLFCICRDGAIDNNIKATTHHGYGMENEVIKVIQRSPKWIPATRDGRVVLGWRRETVTLTIPELLITGIIPFFQTPHCISSLTATTQ